LAKQFVLTEFESAGLSIQGPVRDDNQDAILLPASSAPSPDGSLHAVADGMGGYANGALASKLALQYLLQVVRDSNGTSTPTKGLKQAAEIANFEIYKASQQIDGTRMGTTLTAAFVIGKLLHLLHVGDSRAYLIRNGKISCLTHDHTVVGDMVRAHLLSLEQTRTHAQRSILTRAVGLGLFVQPEISQTELQIGDRIVLCSDGVWSMIEDQKFVELSDQSSTSQALSQNLINLAVERETDDNCSVIAIQIRGFRYQIYEEQPRKESSWLNFFRR
jgi:protein phosphatase